MPLADTFNFDDLAANSLDTLQDAKKFTFEALTGDGFSFIVALANRAMAIKLNEMLNPCETMEAVLAGENLKGQYAGLRDAFRNIRPWLDGLDEAITAKLDALDERSPT